MQLTEDFTKELRELNEQLGLDTVIVSGIDGTDYEVLAVVSKISSVSMGSCHRGSARPAVCQ